MSFDSNLRCSLLSLSPPPAAWSKFWGCREFNVVGWKVKIQAEYEPRLFALNWGVSPYQALPVMPSLLLFWTLFRSTGKPYLGLLLLPTLLTEATTLTTCSTWGTRLCTTTSSTKFVTPSSSISCSAYSDPRYWKRSPQRGTIMWRKPLSNRGS